MCLPHPWRKRPGPGIDPGCARFVAGVFGLAVLGAVAPGSANAEHGGELPNILVTDRREAVDETLRGSKIRLPAGDVPVSAERLDTATIDQTGYRDLAALLHSATSVSANPAEGGVFSDFLLRGFADTPIYRNGINDSIGDRPTRSIANIEYIEILKGPYGALYGPGEPGGSINFVTKKPQSERAGDAAVEFGSFGEFALQLDATGAVLADAGLDYRFIARREQAGTHRDFVKTDRVFANPMLAWQPRPGLRFDVAFEYVSDERVRDNGLFVLDGRVVLPDDRFLGEPGDGPGRVDGYTFQVSSGVRLPGAFELELSLNGQKSRVDGRAAEPDEVIDTAAGPHLTRIATRRDETSHALIAQAEVSGVTMLAGVPHHVLFGTSATGFNEDIRFLASDADDDPYAIDPFNPVYGATAPALGLERDSHEHTRQFSVYAQDLLELGERWRVLLGLRFDHIEQDGSDIASITRFANTSDELSPRVGIVYKPLGGWSLFASYSEAIEPNEGLRPGGGGLAPTSSKAVEVGVKWHSRALPLSLDASVFGIRQTNVTTDAPGNPGFELQTAEQESVGADVEVNAKPFPWLSLTGRYSYVDAQILNDIEVPDGTTPLNVGKHHVSALAFARASLVRPDDVSFGLSLNHLSERQGSLEPEELGVALPGYFRGDLFVAWKMSQYLQFRFSVENFTDERYIAGSQSDALHLAPGVPLTFRGQARVTF